MCCLLSFSICSRLLPINRQKVFFVATHDDSEEGNIGIVADAIKISFHP